MSLELIFLLKFIIFIKQNFIINVYRIIFAHRKVCLFEMG